MTYGSRELEDQRENMKTVTKVNKERKALKGIGTFREPLGVLRDLDKIASVGVESRTPPCQVFFLFYMMHLITHMEDIWKGKDRLNHNSLVFVWLQ